MLYISGLQQAGLPGLTKDPWKITKDDIREFFIKQGLTVPSAIEGVTCETSDLSDWPCFFCVQQPEEECWYCASHAKIGRMCSHLRKSTPRAEMGTDSAGGMGMEYRGIQDASQDFLKRCSSSITDKMSYAKKLIRSSAHLHPHKNAHINWRVTYPCEEIARNAFAMIGQTKLKGVSYQPDPFTQGLVICYRTAGMPKEMFLKLELHVPEDQFTYKGKLGRASKEDCVVEEFSYAPEACNLTEKDVHRKYELDEEDLNCKKAKGYVVYTPDVFASDSLRYARLVTQNWWYATLCKALLVASMALMDLYSNFVYAGTLFNPQTVKTTDLSINCYFRYNFVITFFLLEFLHLMRCWRLAAKDLNAEVTSGAGDIVRPRTKRDWITLRVSSFVFYWVQIPRMVRDIVRTLHPFTNMQEKAAVKVDGTRCFLIGFEDSARYRANSAMGLHRQIPPILFSRAVLTLSKVYYAYATMHWSSIALCMTGVILWPIQVRIFINLIADRRTVYANLKYRVDKNFPDEGGSEQLTLKHIVKEKKLNKLNRQQKSDASTWVKYFVDQGDLHGSYSMFWDAIYKSLRFPMLVLVVANSFVSILTYEGILVSSSTEEMRQTLFSDLHLPMELSASASIDHFHEALPPRSDVCHLLMLAQEAGVAEKHFEKFAPLQCDTAEISRHSTSSIRGQAIPGSELPAEHQKLEEHPILIM